MHADISQLIALRDGEPTDAAVAEHVRSCDACRREISHSRLLRSALRDLPAVSPPAQSWMLIAERRLLECTPPRRTTVRHAVIAASLVASLALAATGGILLRKAPDPESVATVAANESISALQRRSRDLEYLLQRYETPAVMSLHTAGAISELEDGIALIDYRLNTGGDEKRERDLWQQRVDLMETLVTMRAAENYIDSI